MNLVKAPRFHALYEHRIGKTVLTIPRCEWEKIEFVEEKRIEINLDRTPLAGIQNNNQFIISVVMSSPQKLYHS